MPTQHFIPYGQGNSHQQTQETWGAHLTAPADDYDGPYPYQQAAQYSQDPSMQMRYYHQQQQPSIQDQHTPYDPAHGYAPEPHGAQGHQSYDSQPIAAILSQHTFDSDMSERSIAQVAREEAIEPQGRAGIDSYHGYSQHTSRPVRPEPDLSTIRASGVQGSRPPDPTCGEPSASAPNVSVPSVA